MAAIYGQASTMSVKFNGPEPSGRAPLVCATDIIGVIPDELGRLSGALSALDDAVGLLMSKTSQLVDQSPQAGQATSPSGPPERPACEIATSIRTARERLQKLTSAIVSRCHELQV